MNRRGFLTGFAALAGLAVVPSTLPALPLTGQDRLAAAIKSGLVEDQTFVLSGSIDLRKVTNLMIRRCEFIFQGNPELPFVIMKGGDDGNVIRDCSFRHA